MDEHKVPSKVLQKVFESEPGLVAHDGDRMSLQVFRTHPEIQPRMCTDEHVDKRVDQLLERGCWIAQFRAVALLGMCTTDTVNKCRHGEGCRGCPQLYVVDGNHRYLAIKKIQNMKEEEKPQDLEKHKWATFRDENFFIPVDVYQMVPASICRLIAFCATEVQVEGALQNSSADKLNFAKNMYLSALDAGASLTNTTDVQNLIRTTKLGKRSAEAEVLSWYFRLFRAVVKIRTEGLGDMWRFPFKTMSMSSEATHHRTVRELTEFLVNLNAMDAAGFCANLKVTAKHSTSKVSFLPGIRTISGFFGKRVGVLHSLVEAQDFWIWTYMLWIKEITMNETWAFPEPEGIEPGQWIKPPDMQTVLSRLEVVRGIHTLSLQNKAKGCPTTDDQAYYFHELFRFELRYRQCWVSFFSADDLTDLNIWVFRWNRYLKDSLTDLSAECRRSMKKMVRAAPRDTDVCVVRSEGDEDVEGTADTQAWRTPGKNFCRNNRKHQKNPAKNWVCYEQFFCNLEAAHTKTILKI